MGGGGGGVSEPCKAGGLRKNPFLFRSLQLPARILLSFPLLSNDHWPTSDYPFHNSVSAKFRTTCIVFS